MRTDITPNTRRVAIWVVHPFNDYNQQRAQSYSARQTDTALVDFPLLPTCEKAVTHKWIGRLNMKARMPPWLLARKLLAPQVK